MKAEDIAARFDDRPGFRLVDYDEVGLPVYKLTATALLLAKKSLSPIEEFVLRSIDMGFSHVSEIGALLGLSEFIVRAALANLIRSEDIFEKSDSSVALKPKGSITVKSEVTITPREQTIVFYYDGLTRKPRLFSKLELYSPIQASASGLRQIRSFPARKPNIDELDVNDVFETLKKTARSSEEQLQLLRIKEIRFAHRLFVGGIMLVYRSKSTDDVQVGFAIDGRRSEEHELAFLKAGGPKILGIEDSVRMTNIEKEQKQALGSKCRWVREKAKSAEKEAEKLQREIASAKFVTEIAEQKLESAMDVVHVEKARNELGIIQGRVVKIEDALKKVPVRPIPVYEHPRILGVSINKANSRLMIISPWITPAVVNRDMIDSLGALLERNVQLYIGYGISAEPSERDINSSVQELQKLSDSYANFSFVRMGNTHAKVLIKDSEFYIITSFNWLSFKGDPKRTYREEWGTYVGFQEQVDQYFSELLPRFKV